MRLAILAIVGVAAAAPQYAYGPPPPYGPAYYGPPVIVESGPRGLLGGILDGVGNLVGDLAGNFIPWIRTADGQVVPAAEVTEAQPEAQQ